MFKFAVMQNVFGDIKQVGIVMADNLSIAQRKALMLYNKRVWVERLST
jgi:hypothetical protein